MPSELGASIRGTGCLLTQATGEPLPKGGHLAQLFSLLLGRVDGPGRVPQQVELPRRGAHQAREQALGHRRAPALQGVPEGQLTTRSVLQQPARARTLYLPAVPEGPAPDSISGSREVFEYSTRE